MAEGHKVHYLGREQMREAIEDTGATFHNDIHVQKDFYDAWRFRVTVCFFKWKLEMQLRNEKNPALLSIESWLVTRDPCNGLS